MRLALLLILVASPLLAATADEAYDSLLQAHKAKRYSEALNQAETFIKELKKGHR